MKPILRLAGVCALGAAGLLAACAPLSVPQPAPGQPAATETTVVAPTTAPTDSAPATATPLPLAPTPVPTLDTSGAPIPLVPVPPTEVPFVGPLPPELEAKLSADLEARSGAARADFVLVRAEAVIWNDGSLGCPQPGMFYTQALVEGFWVVWQVGDRQYDYRATQRGTFILCEPSAAGQPGDLPPTPVLIVPEGFTLPGDSTQPTQASAGP